MNVYTDDHLPAEPWRRDAACLTADPDAWFPEKGEDATDARKICATRCDVRSECLEWALRTRPPHGIYAGYSVKQLQKMRRKAAA